MNADEAAERAAREGLMSLARSVRQVVHERRCCDNEFTVINDPPAAGNPRFYCRAAGLVQRRDTGGFTPPSLKHGQWFEVMFDLVTTDRGRITLVVRNAKGPDGFHLSVSTQRPPAGAGDARDQNPGTEFHLCDVHSGLTVCISVVDVNVLVVNKAFTINASGADLAPHVNGLATLHTNRKGVWYFQSALSPEPTSIRISALREWSWA